MSDRKRLRRDEPARVGPIRDFSKLYHHSDSKNGSSPAEPAKPETSRKARSGGPLAEGVELAYSVIEKYIAEGRRTAEGISNQPYSIRAASDNLQGILERVLRFQAEILPLLIESLATLVKVDPSGNGFGAAAAAWAHANGAQNKDTLAASIEVVSLRPVQVSIDLRPDAEADPLVALALNAVDAKHPALTDVQFVADEIPGRVKLRVRVPESQPPGIYSGVIVNRDSGETRGTLSIRIVKQS
jgi:hypothetical protein